MVTDKDLGDPRAAVLASLAERGVAISLGLGVAEPERWIHRRVETIAFVDTTTVRRRISLDLTIGPDTPEIVIGKSSARLVTLALLEKRTLSSLDVFDEGGRTLPVLTSHQNGALAGHVLCAIAKALSSGADTSSIDAELRAIATLPREEAEAKRVLLRDTLSQLPESDPMRRLSSSSVFSDFVRSFAQNFILVTMVPSSVGERRILKFSYLGPIEEVSPNWRTWVAATMGWQPREFNLTLPGLINCESYHVEVEVPEGVSVNGAVLFERGLDNTKASDIPDDHLGEFRRTGSRSLHFHASSRGTEYAEVRLWMRIAREGWLTAAAFAAAGVAVLAIANALFLHRLLGVQPSKLGQEPEKAAVSSDVAALLIGLVSVLASVAVRVGEHRVTARAVFGVRLVTMLSVVTPLVAGWMLAFGPKESALQTAWWVLAALAVVFALIVLYAWRGPKAVTPPS